MVTSLVAALVIVVASALIGRALFLLLGRRERTWLEPAAGFALMLVVASITTRFLDSGDAASILLALLVVAAIAVLRRDLLDRESLRVGAPVAALALALACLPFIASYRIGILGVGINSDLASHLLWADWLRDQPVPIPVGVANGYPVGPHSLAASLGVIPKIDMVEAVSGLLLALAALTALTSLAALRELPASRRIPAAALVALAYPLASALAVGGFKENVMALLVLAFALALWRLERTWPGDRATAVTLGLLCAGMLSAYSYPGLYWPIAAAGLLAVAGLVRAARGTGVRAGVRRALAPVGIALGVLLVTGLTEMSRARTFEDISGVRIVLKSDGKLRESVSPLETLGAWPSSDFLQGAAGLGAAPLFGLLGLAGLAAGLAWFLRRGELALPLALLGALAVYLGSLLEAGLYVQSKALIIPGALAMLIALRGLLAHREEWPGWAPAWARGALAAAFVAIAAYSSFLALRDAVVAPNERGSELAQIRERIGPDEWVLSLTSDRFTDYGLRSTRVASPARNVQQPVRSRAGKDYRLPLDFDSTDAGVYDAFDWVLTTSAPYRSAPPKNLHLELETPSYQLWRREGPTPQNLRVFGEEGRPGKILRCRPQDRAAGKKRKQATNATVIDPRPVIEKRRDWAPDNRLRPGDSARQKLKLERGRWQLSIQYHSPLVALEVEAGELSVELSPAMDGAIPFRLGEGPFWSLGEVRSTGGYIPIEITAARAPAISRLLGVDAEAVLGNIVATRPEPYRRIRFRRACGLYVDHYRIPPEEAKKLRPIGLPPRPPDQLAAESKAKREQAQN